ncbi:MAG: hydroxymethylglutaryl-CoA lyase [Planctomycetota bacterium]
MAERVRITDVAPRDGLQGEPAPVSTADKRRLITALQDAGVDAIEVTSFVRPDLIPQLADAGELVASLAEVKRPGIEYIALVPNERGLVGALAANDAAGSRVIDTIAVFASASETFSQKNINTDIDGSLERFEPVIDRALTEGLRVRAYVSCVIACPFEGVIDPEDVGSLVLRLAELGAHEIDLGDTIGAGDEGTTAMMLTEVMGTLGDSDLLPGLTLHPHDTFGRASDCVRAALDLGLRSFDGAAGGLGGCPFASTPQRRAPGNIATSTLRRTIEAAGFETSIDPSKLAIADAVASRILADASARSIGDAS